MDLRAHPVTQGTVDALMAGHPALAGKLGRDDSGKKMLAITFDFKVVTGQAGSNEAAHIISGGI